MNTKTEAESIAALARDAADPRVLDANGGRQFLILPHGQHAFDVTDRNANPPDLPGHVAQAVVLQTSDSLIAYANRFRTVVSIILADMPTSTMVALLDYHEAADAAPAVPNHNAHRATLTLPFSEEWSVWKGIDGKLMSQLDFARFLEENAPDVLAPSGADLLEVCRDLQARRKVDFRKAVRTATDNESFEYSDQTETTRAGGGAIEVPTQFALQIPVYFGARLVELRAFLRWKLSEEGGLQLGIKLHRAEHVRQAMFRELVDQVALSTDLPAMYGKAERQSDARTLDAHQLI